MMMVGQGEECHKIAIGEGFCSSRKEWPEPPGWIEGCSSSSFGDDRLKSDRGCRGDDLLRCCEDDHVLMASADDVFTGTSLCPVIADSGAPHGGSANDERNEPMNHEAGDKTLMTGSWTSFPLNPIFNQSFTESFQAL